jgi:hypothetical protein
LPLIVIIKQLNVVMALLLDPFVPHLSNSLYNGRPGVLLQYCINFGSLVTLNFISVEDPFHNVIDQTL